MKPRSRRPEICRFCGSPILKPTKVNHARHFALTVCTLGLWSVSWIGAVIHARLLPWRCSTCSHHQAGRPPRPGEDG